MENPRDQSRPVAVTFEEIYRSNCRPLARYISRYCGAEFAADDVVQQAFLKLWEKWPLEDPPKNMRAWLYGFVFNTLRTMRARRSATAEARAGQYDPELDARSCPATQEQSVYIRELRGFIADLGPRQSATLNEIANGASALDIAEMQGCSLSSTTMALSLGRRRLRERLGDDLMLTA